MPWTTNDRVVALRRRNPVVDVTVETLDGWRRHQSGRNASLLSFWGFLSIFPLLIAATTLLGLILEGNEELQEDVIEGALDDIPVLGAQLANDPASLDGSVFVLVVGLLAALWSGTRAFVGLQSALDDTWEIDVDDRVSMPIQRGKALGAILLVALSQLGSISLGALIQTAGYPQIGRIALVLATVTIHTLVIAVVFRYLTSSLTPWRDVWMGAIAAGVAYAVIQYYATALVGRITENASDTYGQFALVLGLVTWLGFLAIASLMGAELNAARARLRDAGPAGAS